MKKRLLITITLLPIVTLAGCNLLEYPLYVLLGDSTVSVKAEYLGLRDKRIAVLVMTTPAVDFEHPYAQLELTNQLSLVLSRHVKDSQFVDPEEIDRFQREDLDWLRLPIHKIGQKFDAQRIVYLDIIQYTMSEENSVNLLRGRIWAEVSVYDMEATEPDTPCYTTEITVVVPEHAPVPIGGGARQQIELQTIQMFAEELAHKFYDHKIDRHNASRPSQEGITQ